MALVRSNYVGRTFIEPQQSIRHFGVKLKHSPVPELLRGKRVVVVDDSIVRGTTSRKIVRMVREAGATEVHLRISSPPTRWPCHYGIDTPTRDELIAATSEIEDINRYITSDSLAYLSLEAMLNAVEQTRAGRRPKNGSLPMLQGGSEGHCHACFSGDYPVAFQELSRPRQMRLQNL
jgi:amidophosphoribosyltransferase